jgi:hypothetical protein
MHAYTQRARLLQSNMFGLTRAQLAQMLAETEWGDKSKRYFLNREEEHVGGLKAATAIWSVAVHTRQRVLTDLVQGTEMWNWPCSGTW